MLQIILWVVFALFLVVVALYPDITQPKDSILISGTTDYVKDLSAYKLSYDLDRMHEFAILSAAAYAGRSYEHLTHEFESMQGLWVVVEDLEQHTQDMIAKSIRENVGGFHYQVFKRTQPSSQNKQVYAIVFRGTDSGIDFVSNFRWVTQFIPFITDQYDFVRKNMKDIISAIDAVYGADVVDLEIIATGHSLGGGLAQKAAYSTDRIKTVFAYAPSSVTGFFDVKRQDRNRRKKGMCIYRIHERGEILAYLRRILKLVYPVLQINPKIVEIRCDFKELTDNFIGLHSIEPLAKSLVRAWNERQ